MRQDISMNLMTTDHHNGQIQWNQLINHRREPNATLLMR
jgi:hypothetical protein